jgi:hypothetical protein
MAAMTQDRLTPDREPLYPFKGQERRVAGFTPSEWKMFPIWAIASGAALIGAGIVLLFMGLCHG